VTPQHGSIRNLLVQGKYIIINGQIINFYCNLALNVSVSRRSRLLPASLCAAPSVSDSMPWCFVVLVYFILFLN